MLMIESIPADFDTSAAPVVYSSVAQLSKKACEPAGASYHAYCQRSVLGEVTDGKRTKSDKKSEPTEAETSEAKLRKVWEDENKTDAPPSEDNLYEVLGLGHLGIESTQKQIKKAYQKAILIHHPDKHQATISTEEEKEEVDAHWLLVQKAWKTLGNTTSKRQYDSSFDFDDWIPSGEETFDTPEAFFELYGPVFDRNARFSQKSRVPSLGDDNTSIEQVEKFYAFWNRFDSWREFVKNDEYNEIDLENAESREEKRWMIRKNETTRKKLKRKEYERLAELVSRAYRVDPRLVRERTRLQIEKTERETARRKAKAEAEQKAEEERIKAETERVESERKAKESAAAERKAKQTAKKKLKKKKKLLLQLCTLAMEALEVDPKRKVSLYDMLNDVSDAAKSEQDLVNFCEAFQDLSAENSNSENGKANAKAGLAFLQSNFGKSQTESDACFGMEDLHKTESKLMLPVC